MRHFPGLRVARIAAVFLAAGFWATAATAVPLTVMFERNTDVASNELIFRTYANFADMANNIPSGPDLISPINISSVFDTSGLTWDGSQFIMMFERNTDVASNELIFRTYATFADMANNIPSGPDLISPINISSVFDTSGLTWDGNQFITMFERNTDVGSNELIFRTYATFADMANNIASGPDLISPINIASVFDTSGLMAVWQPEGGGGSVPVPEPGALALFGLGLAGLWCARRRHDPACRAGRGSA